MTVNNKFVGSKDCTLSLIGPATISHGVILHLSDIQCVGYIAILGRPVVAVFVINGLLSICKPCSAEISSIKTLANYRMAMSRKWID